MAMKRWATCNGISEEWRERDSVKENEECGS